MDCGLTIDGVIVAGGREGSVGVAGLLLGGGVSKIAGLTETIPVLMAVFQISYYVSRVGFACGQLNTPTSSELLLA